MKPDNLHMVGPSGMMKMTDSVLAVLASKGVIEEAGKTGYWKKKTDNSQPWQEAGDRRQDRAPRRRQEEPWQEAGGWTPCILQENPCGTFWQQESPAARSPVCS